MKNAILLHGLPSEHEYYDEKFPSASNAHWFPWLQKQLLIKDIKADTPEVPKPFEMSWDNWVKEVERFEITDETLLVGHSMGAGFWVRYLSEHPEIHVSKVLLVAPWLNLSHEVDSSFFEYEFNSEIAKQIDQLVVFSSDNDGKEMQDTVMYLHEKLPALKLVNFHNYGHFCYRDLKTDAFPEALNELIL